MLKMFLIITGIIVLVGFSAAFRLVKKSSIMIYVTGTYGNKACRAFNHSVVITKPATDSIFHWYTTEKCAPATQAAFLPIDDEEY